MHKAVNWFGTKASALAWLWALFIVPRLALVLQGVEPTSDAAWYYSRAEKLAAGLGYLGDHGAPTAYWPPGWPLALSVPFSLFGASPLVVGLFNLATAVLGGWLLLDLARRVGGSELAARTALLLFAVYPNAIAYGPLALTEVFYTTLLLAICWLLVGGRKISTLVLAGLLLGVATLVKAQTLVVVPLILAIELLGKEGFWRRLPAALAKIAALIALAALVVAPWTIRNHRELGRWVAVSTNGGATLFASNNDTARGDFTPQDPAFAAFDARKGGDEVTHDAEGKALGLEWIKAHPARFVQLIPLKLFRLWGPDGEGDWAYQGGYPRYGAFESAFRAVRLANQGYYVLLLLGFAVAALVQLMGRWKARGRLIGWWALPYGIAAYPSSIAVVFSGQSRFHYPVMPFVCLACGWLLADWWAKRAARAA